MTAASIMSSDQRRSFYCAARKSCAARQSVKWIIGPCWSSSLCESSDIFMKQLVLETRELTKSYRRRVVVDHLSLMVESGDIFGFLGQNGAGKSTTIRMALGLVRPT